MKFKSTASYLLITFFLAAIVISFAFTGFTGFSSSTGAVAKVGSEEVTIDEYQRAYNAEVQRFSQIFGGNSLTAAQIRQFRIKEGALNRLVQQKLILELANKMNIQVSREEIKEEIKQAEYFLTGGKFDVNKYKSLLSANGFTPAKFEEMTVNTVKMKKISDIFEGVVLSRNSVEAQEMIQESSAKVNAVQINKDELVKYINVSKAEVNKFVSNKDNESILNSLFNSMKNEFNKPEKVTARHILIKADPKNPDAALKKAQAIRKKVNTKNFASIAGKETEDPSGKGKKGGSLGSFTRGKMVPEFEKVAFSMKPGQISKPVKTSFGYHIIYVQKKDKGVTKTLNQVKDKVAKTHLQKTNRDALKALQAQVKDRAIALLKSNNTQALKKYADQYGLGLEIGANVNAIDAKAEEISLSVEDMTQVISNNDTQKVFTNEGATKTIVFKATSIKEQKDIVKDVEKSLKEEITASNTMLSTRLQSEMLKYLEGGVDVVTYPNLL